VLPGTVFGCVELPGVVVVLDGVLLDGVLLEGVVVWANTAVDPNNAIASMFNFIAFMTIGFSDESLM